MKYEKIVEGIFVSRPNRFIANVIIDGREETVHVKNTGRCKELLVPGATVYLSVSDNPKRRTKYDLIAVIKQRNEDSLLINMDSQIPNYVAEEFLKNSDLFPASTTFKREVKYGNSRFDLYAENNGHKAFIEVKGVTLEKDGIALFPDAPTERGVKHINELILAKSCGYDAYIFFVIQMKGITKFMPNSPMHPEFAKALYNAKEAGVKIIAYDCIVTPDSIVIDKPITTDAGKY